MSKAFVIPSRFTAIDQFSPAVEKMSKNASASLDRMERKMRSVSDTAFKVSKNTALIGGAIIAPLGLAVNEAIKFEEKMANVSTLIDTNAESMEKMGDDVLSLSRKLPVAIDDLATSLYDIRSAGVPAAQAMSTLDYSAKLAVAGLATATEGTNLMTSAVNAFADEGLSAAEISDILFKTVKAGKTTVSQLATGFGATAPIIQSAGVALSDFQAATAALTTVGTPATQAQNQLRAAIVSMQKPTSDMQKVFQKLGVTTEKELIAKEGSMVGAFEAINKAGTDMGLNLSKAWGSVEAAAAVTSLTGATNQAYTKTLEDMRHGSNALNDGFDKQSKTGKAGMQLMKNNLQALGITIGNALLPMINNLLESVTPMIERFSDWMNRNKPLVATIAKTAAVIGALLLSISAVSAVVGVVAKGLSMAKIAMVAFNAVVAINPIVLLTGAVVALGAAVYSFARSYRSATSSIELNNEVTKKASERTFDQRFELKQLFNDLRMTTVGTDEYKSKLSQLEAIQPGIIDKYNLQAGAARDLSAAEKELGDNVMERMKKEINAEMMREKMREAMIKKEEGPAWYQSLAEFGARSTAALFTMGGSESAGFGSNIAEDWNNRDVNRLESEAVRHQIMSLSNEQLDMLKSVLPSINPESARNESITESINKQEQTLKIELTGLPEGSNASITGNGGMAIPVTSSTR